MIKVDNKVINPDELMERIRRNILIKDIEVENGSFEFTEKSDTDKIQRQLMIFKENVQIVNRTWNISDSSITSHRKFIGPAIVFIKRLIRKSTYWLIRPYWEQQIQFNGAVAKSISDIMKIQEEFVKR